ncbi:MAG: hypothetical protein ACFCUI_01090 [Bernardetiaceae bacterium]
MTTHRSLSQVFFWGLLLLPLWLYGQEDDASETSTLKKERVKINRGSRYTRTPIVTLSLAAFDKTHMQIKNRPDFNNDDIWIPYQPRVYGWRLGQEEGLQRVYVRFKDAKGTLSATVSDEIELDMTKPAPPAVSIKSETKAVGSPEQTVLLMIKTNDPDDARYMMVSNSRTFFRKRWQLRRDSIPDWKLTGSLDGKRTVFVNFRDKAGNVSDVGTTSIDVDTFAPVRASLVIENGAEFTTLPRKSVILTLFAIGATEMLIANTEDFAGAEWQPFAKSVSQWKLAGDSGTQTVYAKFRDEAHNESDVVKDDILVDALPPQNCSVLINAGDEISRHLDGYVELSLKAEDATMMLISNSKDFKNAQWQAYEELITDWRLAGPNGEKTVYVKFRDDAGNEAAPVSDSILLIR